MSKNRSNKCEMCWKDERKLTPATHYIEGKKIDSNDNPVSQSVCEKHFNRIFNTQI